MNPIYGQWLKTLKASSAQQIPKFQQKMLDFIVSDVKRTMGQIKEIKMKQSQLQAQLAPITSSQIANLPENVAKRDQFNFLGAKLAVQLDANYRIKRFMFIYYNTRLNKIEDNYWNYCGNVTQEVKESLSKEQRDYLKNYKDVVAQYMKDEGLQLTYDLEPPFGQSVQVRFINDCGQILSQEGEPIRLQKNTVIFLKRKLVEPFIRNGSAVIVNVRTY